MSQYKEVSNRHFVFPSVRNRILGLQLYQFNIKGFLHWGYNFCYSQLSRKAIDPFRVTDVDKRFPSGEAFLVYPGKNGPIESIRLEVFYEGLQDMRALIALEEQAGCNYVIEIIEASLKEPLTFKKYPRNSKWLLDMREKINEEIASLSKAAST